MARPGPQPKTTRHGHGGAGWIDVPNVPYDGPGSARDLPEIQGLAWFPQVEAWWEVIRVMPHCDLWEASDWLFAIETALLKNHYMAEFFGGVVHATMATEIRRREDQMGTTMEARRKLGIRYVDPAETKTEEQPAEGGEPAEGVTPITAAKSRRERLAG
jgi:hypothetical protein